MKLAPKAALALLAALSIAAPAAAGEPPAAGAKAPAFTLPSQDGFTVSLEQYKGRWVVLYFYPKDFTSGCTLEAHNFQRDLAKYEKANAVILGVSLDSVDSHKDFCTKEGLGFRLLSDAGKTATAAYGSLVTSPERVIAARNTFLIGPDGVVRKVFLKVNPSVHSDEVLAALAELQAKK
ncbi:MAG TPA: peroxiredoxin [Thermoanaerobaculia bacterium]|nr:peroxiredoxin [Thermoanaerobaculia bacterium]HQR65910.1 peroxiredoxin [Thermoanaerobaculia bacterium]